MQSFFFILPERSSEEGWAGLSIFLEEEDLREEEGLVAEGKVAVAVLVGSIPLVAAASATPRLRLQVET